MKRRDVLSMTAASIVASILPLPAWAAAPADVDYFGSHDFSAEKFEMVVQVNTACGVLERMDLSGSHTAGFFGFYLGRSPTISDLQAKVLDLIEMSDIETTDRVRFLDSISSVI